MKLALTLSGAVALLCGVAFVVVGCLVYLGSPSGPDVDALSDALDTIAIGTLGALFGSALIVYAALTSQRDA
jgi:hypothetical protein